MASTNAYQQWDSYVKTCKEDVKKIEDAIKKLRHERNGFVQSVNQVDDKLRTEPQRLEELKNHPLYLSFNPGSGKAHGDDSLESLKVAETLTQPQTAASTVARAESTQLVAELSTRALTPGPATYDKEIYLADQSNQSDLRISDRSRYPIQPAVSYPYGLPSNFSAFQATYHGPANANDNYVTNAKLDRLKEAGLVNAVVEDGKAYLLYCRFPGCGMNALALSTGGSFMKGINGVRTHIAMVHLPKAQPDQSASELKADREQHVGRQPISGEDVTLILKGENPKRDIKIIRPEEVKSKIGRNEIFKVQGATSKTHPSGSSSHPTVLPNPAQQLDAAGDVALSNAPHGRKRRYDATQATPADRVTDDDTTSKNGDDGYRPYPKRKNRTSQSYADEAYDHYKDF